MFEELFEQPHTIERYRSAPLYEDRVRYLAHVAESDAKPLTLYKIANSRLHLVRLVDLRAGETVSVPRLAAIARPRLHPKGHSGTQRPLSRASRNFLGHALRWLRFIGRVEESTEPRHPYADEIEAFAIWMRDERGLSEGTIRARCQAVADFLNRLAARNVPLAAVEMTDIDEAIAAKMACGTYKRATIHNYARYVRTFLRFVEDRGRCRSGLADGVMPSRIYGDDTIPSGLLRDDVRSARYRYAHLPRTLT